MERAGIVQTGVGRERPRKIGAGGNFFKPQTSYSSIVVFSAEKNKTEVEEAELFPRRGRGPWGLGRGGASGLQRLARRGWAGPPAPGPRPPADVPSGSALPGAPAAARASTRPGGSQRRAGGPSCLAHIGEGSSLVRAPSCWFPSPSPSRRMSLGCGKDKGIPGHYSPKYLF